MCVCVYCMFNDVQSIGWEYYSIQYILECIYMYFNMLIIIRWFLHVVGSYAPTHPGW